ncbi:phosphonopyruvate decarboxylase [Nocardia terpenica]|uniref:Phosphonopyruvate decarboxylase n=1 Tax=Nocardia terpenica TaxID=455432 RepID=A0A164PFW7_9NOCA|nr:phosphonopyruvate decarboxylase [Nocardia terpenica]KZM75513.1 phosphonopyruvate decarboxylase [Nocardia terpenica]NQE85990.1 phosphonopyruvate decarboxylase [Nocardia terpenica]
MFTADSLLIELTARGVGEVTGVPCSYLTPLINRVASNDRVSYFPATHEGEAVAIAAGSWLAGAITCVISQNSGLGNMVNPLTSLCHPCRIPVPMIVTWRGEPGVADEPQHELLGAKTPDLLTLIGVGHSVLPSKPERLSATVGLGWEAMQRDELPYAFILRGGSIAPEALSETWSTGAAESVVMGGRDRPRKCSRRIDALDTLLSAVVDSAAIVSTTGKTSRELFTLADRPQHFYLVGAMGSASAVGLGVARHTSTPVVVVDGDGASLMRMGTFATVGAAGPPSLIHILLDNQVHDSTGGQRTQAEYVNFPAVAAACGYRWVFDCADLLEFEFAVQRAQTTQGPVFIYLRIKPGSIENLGRPTVRPSDVARRFRDFVKASKAGWDTAQTMEEAHCIEQL